jgi:hypothetical protein
VLLIVTDADLIITGTGVLTAQGTSSEKITFTADHNKNHVHGESGETWGHISFQNMNSGAGTSLIDYCLIEYGYKYTGISELNSCGGGLQIEFRNILLLERTIPGGVVEFLFILGKIQKLKIAK